MRSTPFKNRLTEHFLSHQALWAPLLLISWLSVHLALNTTTALMEAKRGGSILPLWEPLCWETTSIFMVALLAWPLAQLLKYWPRHIQWFWQGLLHVCALLLFSVVHVSAMVALRKLCYALMGSYYDFGDWRYEFIYELRKDTVAYLSLIIVICAYRFIVRRIQGESSLLAKAENTAEVMPDKLLVKKLGKEFLIAIESIEWVEAAGNYANLHVGERVFPMRITMTQLSQQLPPQQFARIHRSTIVNLNQVAHIEAQEAGDHALTLKNGTALTLSRRYRDTFKGQLRL